MQYGQYYASTTNWREASKNNPMVMTSMMLYLDRMTNVDRELPEYTETQVWFGFDTFFRALIGPGVKFRLAIFGYWWRRGANVRHVFCNICWNFGLDNFLSS